MTFAKPKEGALTWVCGAMIHKDAPHLDKAHDVIDWMLSVERGVWLIDENGYGHSNKKSFDAIPDARLAELGLSRNPVEVLGRRKVSDPAEPGVRDQDEPGIRADKSRILGRYQFRRGQPRARIRGRPSGAYGPAEPAPSRVSGLENNKIKLAVQAV